MIARPALGAITLFATVGLLGVGPGCLQDVSPPGDEPEPSGGTDVRITLDVVLSDVVPTVAFVEGTVVGADMDEAGLLLVTADGQVSDHDVHADPSGFRATLLGLKASTPYTAVLRVAHGLGEVTLAQRTFVTGDAPLSIPDMESTVHGDEERQGYLVTSVVKERSMAVILDRDGDLVWWHEPDEELCLITRAVLARDGASVLYLLEMPGEESDENPSDIKSQLVRVSLDGTEVSRQTVHGCHHDFVELPDGTVALITTDMREVDGEPSLADALVELLPSGELLDVWSVWDDFEPDPAWTAGLPDADMGWSHANALDYDEATDSYLVGLRNIDAIVAVSRDSGELLWQFGGMHSDFVPADVDGHFFQQQHQFQLLDGGMLVFDNGMPTRYESRVVEYALQPISGVATEVARYVTTPAQYCPVLGDVTRTDEGTTLITWGTAGLLEEVSPQGELLWSLGLGYGAALGYTTLVDELPSP